MLLLNLPGLAMRGVGVLCSRPAESPAPLRPKSPRVPSPARPGRPPSPRRRHADLAAWEAPPGGAKASPLTGVAADLQRPPTARISLHTRSRPPRGRHPRRRPAPACPNAEHPARLEASPGSRPDAGRMPGRVPSRGGQQGGLEGGVRPPFGARPAPTPPPPPLRCRFGGLGVVTRRRNGTGCDRGSRRLPAPPYGPHFASYLSSRSRLPCRGAAGHATRSPRQAASFGAAAAAQDGGGGWWNSGGGLRAAFGVAGGCTKAVGRCFQNPSFPQSPCRHVPKEESNGN